MDETAAHKRIRILMIGNCRYDDAICGSFVLYANHTAR